jgi:hypothetical protein
VPEFVANIVTMHLVERMNFTSGDFPHEENEFDWACLTPAPSAKVRPFRVAEAKAHLECEVAQIVTDRNTNIVLGRIVHAHVDPSVWKNGRSTRNCSILSAVCLAPVMRHSAIWSTSSARNGKTSRAPQAWTRCRGRNGGSAASGSLPGSIRQSATTMLSVPGDRTFESISLQRRVLCESDFLDQGAENFAGRVVLAMPPCRLSPV